MPEPELSVFDGELPLFEQRGVSNGRSSECVTWSAADVAKWLGYTDLSQFKPVLKRATEVLLNLNIEVTDHFFQEVSSDGKKDIRLSRGACYLAAMNGDPKKRQVALAQAYFVRFSELCQRWLDDGEPIERLLIRKEVSKHERTLSQTAKQAGVEDFGLFRSAGYRGLYNMSFAELKKLKGIPEDRTPLDFMGKDELAANLFRITQTDAKIKNKGIRGQAKLERAAQDVGKAVRDTMEKISGQKPEELAPQEDIRIVKKGLKDATNNLKHGTVSDLAELPRKDGAYLELPEETEL